MCHPSINQLPSNLSILQMVQYSDFEESLLDEIGTLWLSTTFATSILPISNFTLANFSFDYSIAMTREDRGIYRANINALFHGNKCFSIPYHPESSKGSITSGTIWNFKLDGPQRNWEVWGGGWGFRMATLCTIWLLDNISDV